MTITDKDLADLEKFSNNLFFNSKIKKEATFHFTYHFSDERLNDERNNPAISLNELKEILKKFKNKHLDSLYSLKDGQDYVVVCASTNIRIVFAVEEERIKGYDYHRNIAVTIIRKEGFIPYKDDIIFNI